MKHQPIKRPLDVAEAPTHLLHPLARPSLRARAHEYRRSADLREAGLYAFYSETSASRGAEVEIDGQPRINFGSNNYLGLAQDRRVIEAAKAALDRYGSGCTGSRFLNGTLDLHTQLEQRLAKFLGREAALVFSTGYQANLGAITSLVQRGDLLLIDKADHASIVDGGRLSFGKVQRFEHGDAEQLDRMLAAQPRVPALVMVDGVFSMDGEVSDLERLVPVCRRHGALLAVDDAHGLGVLGPRGEGTVGETGTEDGVDVIVGTFSKSLGSIGGFVAGEAELIEYMRHTSRPLMFSAALPPASTAGVLAALEIVESEPERRDRLWRLVHRLRTGLTALGFDLGASSTSILPVYLGTEERALRYFKTLFELGVFTNAVLQPAVPAGTNRLRVSVMATHTDAMIDAACEAFAEARRRVDGE